MICIGIWGLGGGKVHIRHFCSEETVNQNEEPTQDFQRRKWLVLQSRGCYTVQQFVNLETW